MHNDGGSRWPRSTKLAAETCHSTDVQVSSGLPRCDAQDQRMQSMQSRHSRSPSFPTTNSTCSLANVSPSCLAGTGPEEQLEGSPSMKTHQIAGVNSCSAHSLLNLMPRDSHSPKLVPPLETNTSPLYFDSCDLVSPPGALTRQLQHSPESSTSQLYSASHDSNVPVLNSPHQPAGTGTTSRSMGTTVATRGATCNSSSRDASLADSDAAPRTSSQGMCAMIPPRLGSTQPCVVQSCIFSCMLLLNL